MKKKFTLTSKAAAAALLLLAVFFLVGGVPALEADGVDCEAALTRCLLEQSWWERILMADYCFLGYIFCLLYMQ